MFTRQQYMKGELSHNEYYEQFAKPLVSLVKQRIGEKSIIDSTDEHFNDIPLGKWDALAPTVRMMVGAKINKANGNNGVSLSDCVCAAKSAARLIRDSKYS